MFTGIKFCPPEDFALLGTSPRPPATGPPPEIKIYCRQKLVGRLIFKDDGSLDFDGDATKAASVFIDICQRLWKEEKKRR